MFKNIIMYRIAADWSATAAQIEESLDGARFVACGASQEKSIGWIEPRGEANGPLLEVVAGQWIMRLMIETRALPGSVIDKKAKERVAHIKTTTRRTPGKKETREIKDDIKLELMPMAFSKESSVWVWIDPAANLLVIDASSQSRADEVVTMLVKCLPGLAVALIDTKVSPTAAMSAWLITQEPPEFFTVDRECHLKAADESKATVKYGKHPLDTDEVKAHVESGKLPVMLALTWNSRVSFVLTEGLQVKKLAFLDVVFDGASSGKDDGFDADVLIATSELSKMIPGLLDALGGEAVAKDMQVVQANERTAGAAGADKTSAEPPPHHLGSHIDGPDPLYGQAVAIVHKHKKASISLVQRHLLIGYNRAARLIENMEKAGIVSCMNSAGHRNILKTAGEVVA